MIRLIQVLAVTLTGCLAPPASAALTFVQIPDELQGFGPGGVRIFDLNDNGTDDLYFFVTTQTIAAQGFDNSVRIVVRSNANAARLAPGDLLTGSLVELSTRDEVPGPAIWRGERAISMRRCGVPLGGGATCGGEWADEHGSSRIEDGYLGLEITFPDGPHYGFMYIEGLRFKYYAYESQPNTPVTITAIPEPSTALLLTLSLAPLLITRHRFRLFKISVH